MKNGWSLKTSWVVAAYLVGSGYIPATKWLPCLDEVADLTRPSGYLGKGYILAVLRRTSAMSCCICLMGLTISPVFSEIC